MPDNQDFQITRRWTKGILLHNVILATHGGLVLELGGEC